MSEKVEDSNTVEHVEAVSDAGEPQEPWKLKAWVTALALAMAYTSSYYRRPENPDI